MYALWIHWSSGNALEIIMDKDLDGLISYMCLVYLDDVIIYNKTWEETLANLKLAMARLC